MQTAASPVIVEDVSNQEFLERYARPGCVGLSGGVTLVNKERPLTRISCLTKPSHGITQP